jgi:hypothetical protein
MIVHTKTTGTRIIAGLEASESFQYDRPSPLLFHFTVINPHEPISMSEYHQCSQLAGPAGLHMFTAG